MNLVEMSITAAVMIVVIILIRALCLHRLPKKTFLAMWGIVVIRLLVPFQISSPLSVYTLIDPLVGPDVWMGTDQQATGQEEPGGQDLEQPGAGPQDMAQNAALWEMNQQGGQPVTGQEESGQQDLERHETDQMELNRQNVLTASQDAPSKNAFMGITIPEILDSKLYLGLWLSGAVCCALYFAITYVRYIREFKMSLPVENEEVEQFLRKNPLKRRVKARLLGRIRAPLTYGTLHPVILLPASTEKENRKGISYILTHELVHIRRLDGMKKLGLTAAVCIHWFNPLVWIMFSMANRDMELACDEETIHIIGDNSKADYARMLIHMEELKRGPFPLCSGFSRNAVEERIGAIMKSRKRSVTGVLAAGLAVLGLTLGFATSAEGRGTGSLPEPGLLQVDLENLDTGDYQILGKYEFRKGDVVTGTLNWENKGCNLYLALGTESGLFNGLITSGTGYGHMKESITVGAAGSYYVFVGNWQYSEHLSERGTGRVTGQVELPGDIQENEAVSYLRSIQKLVTDNRELSITGLRERIWEVSDSQESRKQLESLTGDEALYRMREHFEPAEFLFYVLLPLTDGREYQDYNGCIYSEEDESEPVLEYSVRYHIKDKESVTAVDYMEIKQGLEEELDAEFYRIVLSRNAEGMDGKLTEKALLKEAEGLKKKWESDDIGIEVFFTYRNQDDILTDGI